MFISTICKNGRKIAVIIKLKLSELYGYQASPKEGKNCAAYLTESGYVGEFVICSEPTQLGIGLQAKGVLQMDITLKGKSAHASKPWEGENAILRALYLYERLLELPFAQESTDFFQKPSINLSKIHGGDVYNKVPDSCVLSMDIRFLPTQNKDEILKQIKSITDCNIAINLYGDPVMNTIDNPYIQKLLPIIKQKALIEDVHVFGQHGFADTRYFSRFGIPAIEFGPSGDHWHGNDEYVVLDSVETYKDILVDFGVGFRG
ncbi:hypothetical protein GCM10011409_24020 [Lentibacillus populi]|uniref:Peptidase M20 dimerisation domain-containing protein n=1 Tax=Lentibacillus populi TaxID=1827502 RepID=A0A9W5TYL3_9BACI|nr:MULTISPECIES: M20/M25/M40 family metallo-hydrolase [Bacillaceae]GGB45649.1 hypothetical protein GCM10011409_24020 [Lentibacillus populi]